MTTIRAVFENGVFKPKTSVELPEHAEVEFEPRQVPLTQSGKDAARKAVLEVLAERYDSGETDVAERHNEHQP